MNASKRLQQGKTALPFRCLAPWLIGLCLIVACLQLSFGSGIAQADARTGYLTRLLRESSQFRVRAQAAISLGDSTARVKVVPALIQALSDPHPAVRIAAIRSLGRLHAEEARAAIAARKQDREAPVRQAAMQTIAALKSQPSPELGPHGVVPGAQYYVAIGTPGTRVPGLGPVQLEQARRFLSARISTLEGVELAPDREDAHRASQVLERRQLKGYFVEASITDVQERPGGGTRVAVSLILATYPGRNMRAILQGAATAVGGGPETFQQAMEGALTGALRKLPQALEH